MKPVNVETLLSHNIGISNSYYRPTENELLEDYLKSVDMLTINDEKITLRRQVAELTENNKQENYIIKGKLSDREKEIEVLLQRDSINTDAIATLSDKMQEIMERMKQLEERR
jgi:phosphoketolase